MNYQSCTIEELIPFSNSGDIKASVEIARRVCEGLLDEYDDTISSLENDVATLDAEYDELLEEETRLNQTIEELKESLSESYSDKDYEVTNLREDVVDLEERVYNLSNELEELRGES